jgi:hypothetical protein
MRRKSNKKQKKLTDDARLLRAWKKFHREERETMLAGPHGSVLNELFRVLANLKHMQPAQLIGYVQSIDWSVIEYDTKLVVIHECNTAITALREKHDLASIDDNLPGEPETPFRTIKAVVLTAFPHHEGAHRGEARPE